MSILAETSEKIKRIPWREYLGQQLYKILGFIVIALLIIGVMIISELMGNLEDIGRAEPLYLLAVALSSICFILVLIGFSKIVLFDMGEEFGLRDPETKKIVFNFRFFLFGSLSLSFCSAIYLLLDVFLRTTYLELLPVLVMEWVLIAFNMNIPGLTDIQDRTTFYQTVRNIYFDFFFIVIIAFSVIVFLSILTSLARRRLISKFKKEEIESMDTQEEEKQNRTIYKMLLWIFTPLINIFVFGIAAPIGNSAPLLSFLLLAIMLGLTIWWFYQLFKIIFLVLWRGFKFTAFLTSVNALIIVPLIFVLYLLPVLAWVGYDIWIAIQNGSISTDFVAIFQAAGYFIQFRAQDLLAIIELDFVIITVVATFIVGFAEGFAIVAIFSAIYRGVEVARTGQIITRSPPKVAVISKYLVMFGVWLGMIWDSFIEVWTMLIEELHIQLPHIEIPSFFYMIYNSIIIPLSGFLSEIIPTLEFIPFLLLPIYFIFSASFKFMSVTLVTPKVRDKLSMFFLLISTVFVLIITNILGDIYELGIPDAPLRSLVFVETILVSAVGIFEYIEAVAFYSGFFFGIIYVVNKVRESRNDSKSLEEFKPTASFDNSK